MPRMTPAGDVGKRGVRAYAARGGQTEKDYLAQLGDLLTAETAGSALVDLVRADPATIAPGYLLTAAGRPRRAGGRVRKSCKRAHRRNRRAKISSHIRAEWFTLC